MSTAPTNRRRGRAKLSSRSTIKKVEWMFILCQPLSAHSVSPDVSFFKKHLRPWHERHTQCTLSRSLVYTQLLRRLRFEPRDVRCVARSNQTAGAAGAAPGPRTRSRYIFAGPPCRPHAHRCKYVVRRKVKQTRLLGLTRGSAIQVSSSTIRSNCLSYC